MNLRIRRLVVLAVTIALCSLAVAWVAWAIQQVTP